MDADAAWFYHGYFDLCFYFCEMWVNTSQSFCDGLVIGYTPYININRFAVREHVINYLKVKKLLTSLT
jgi:hypothetical protein